jgi:hypothetical protein
MLEAMKLPGYEDARGVHFPMRDGDRHIRVFITRTALRGQGSGIPVGEGLARFDTLRSVYEAVAMAKHQTDVFKAPR